MFAKARKIYHEFPRTFWVLVGATFIDQIGAALIFPFFSLYITQKFNVGMLQVGELFGIFTVTGMLGSFVGGGMADRFGRRTVVIFGLVISALSSLAMGLVNDLNVFFGLAVVVGLLSSFGGPARQAMIADILPEKKLAEGFGMFRISFNLAVTFGPMLGGLLAGYSFMLLFIADAVSSIIMAAIVLAVLPETRPEVDKTRPQESFLQTLGGYSRVLRDGLFMGFVGVIALMLLVYMQMNSTLPVYLRDVHNIPAQGYGYILSMNAAMVVLLQFWFTRRFSGFPPMLVMALGTAFFVVGFSMYGFTSTYAMFVLAMIIITIGEMIVTPVAQSIAAQFAPADMRGRYMAIYGFGWSIPGALAPLAAGLIMNAFDPRWVWYAGGIVAMLTVGGYLWLHIRTHPLIHPAQVEAAAPAASD
ncbi:MAG: MFS transporter [Chloroflexota bacterium]